MNEADSKIIELINGHNQEKGFKLMMETHQERLYWHIRRMVTFHEDANDVLQNTFLKAYKGIARFNQNSGLYTWLYRIATNESLTFLKKKQRFVSGEEGGVDDLENKLKADVHFDGQEIYVALQKAVNTLPIKQKAVFNMRYFDEMPYAEMSEILETSQGALKASYHHAVKKIEAYLTKEDIYVG